MDHAEQIAAFASDLQKLIQRYRTEFELPVASAIGVLEMTKLAMFDDEVNSQEPDDGGEGSAP